MSEVACWMGFNTKILKYFEMFPASMSLRILLLSQVQMKIFTVFHPAYPSKL